MERKRRNLQNLLGERSKKKIAWSHDIMKEDSNIAADCLSSGPPEVCGAVVKGVEHISTNLLVDI